jgi:hypothetical protein
MTEERVEEVFKKHYNLDTLLGGQAALARFINDGIINNKGFYKCTDRSRQKFYIMEDGNKKEDPDCDEIIELTSPGLPTVQEVFETALFSTLPELVTEDDIQDNYKHIMTITENRSDFKAEMSKIVGTSSKKISVKEMVVSI